MTHFPDRVRLLPKFNGQFDAYQLNAEGCDVLFASYPAGTVNEFPLCRSLKID